MPPPANDNFANALLLSGVSGAITPVDLDDATTEVGEPQSTAYAGLGPAQTAWYKWVAPSNTTVTLRPTYADGAVFAIWTGATLAALTEVASIDTGASPTGRVSFAATGGTTYWFQAGTFGFEASGLLFGMSWASTPDGRVLIAFDDGPLEPSPAWTRIDHTDNLVAGIDIETGKQTELDRTDTGTATVYLNDTAGLFDPVNTLSPYFGKLDGKQILIQLLNPVTLAWEPQWRGWIDNYGFDINAATNPDGTLVVATIQVDCVDVFDYLGGYQVQPGVNGDTPPPGSEGVVFYEDTAGTVDDRMIQALTEAGIDSSMWVVFTGNVKVQETKYDPGDAILNVLRDAADAEFPGIANLYVDRFGRFVFHGREARFDPDTVSAGATPGAWDFMRWKVGDGAAIGLDSDRAQMRVLSYSHGRGDIVNSTSSWPRGIAEADLPGQVFEDATSISDFGKHSLPPMADLIISEGTTTGNTANVECQKFAEFFVHYLKDPQTRVTALTVKAIGPADPRAAATWDVLCRADISDIMDVKVGYPGGVGIDAVENYIEGFSKRIRPLNPTHDSVEADYRLTPTAWAMDPDGVFA